MILGLLEVRINRPVVNKKSSYVEPIIRSPICESYDTTGIFLAHHKFKTFSIRSANVSLDKEGVPVNVFRWGGPYYFATTICHYGLECHAKSIVHDDKGELEKCYVILNWLKKNQDNSGGWQIPFDRHFYPSRTKEIKAPWYNAMSQGLAMSFLTRMRAVDPDFVPEAMIVDAHRVFTIPSAENGVMANFNGNVWYEEYPCQPSSFVLNGFIYALLGLHDAASFTGDARIRELYQDGLTSLKNMLSYFDLGWCTAYDLTHLAVYEAAPNIARWQYHWLHVNLLSALNIIEDGVFTSYVNRWHEYLYGGHVRQN